MRSEKCHSPVWARQLSLHPTRSANASSHHHPRRCASRVRRPLRPARGMLRRFTAVGLRAASLRLYARACTLRFTLDHYLPAIEAGTLAAHRWTTDYLSEENERDDAVGPYRKSLLYPVRRACEEAHKTPLLGVQHAFEQSVKLTEQDDPWCRSAAAEFAEWVAFRKCGTGRDSGRCRSGSGVCAMAGGRSGRRTAALAMPRRLWGRRLMRYEGGAGWGVRWGCGAITEFKSPPRRAPRTRPHRQRTARWVSWSDSESGRGRSS